VQDERVLGVETRTADERLTSRLEAFGDLVFGFSLSLIALRLDVPSRVEEILEPTRWLTVIITFALICRFWLEQLPDLPAPLRRPNAGYGGQFCLSLRDRYPALRGADLSPI
jgi:hypothetical protein